MGESLPAERLWDTDQLAVALGRDPSGFLGHLLRLLCKADFDNLERLRQVFPVEVAIYGLWQQVRHHDGGAPTLEDLAKMYAFCCAIPGLLYSDPELQAGVAEHYGALVLAQGGD